MYQTQSNHSISDFKIEPFHFLVFSNQTHSENSPLTDDPYSFAASPSTARDTNASYTLPRLDTISHAPFYPVFNVLRHEARSYTYPIHLLSRLKQPSLSVAQSTLHKINPFWAARLIFSVLGEATKN
jgi:hypothetical protein